MSDTRNVKLGVCRVTWGGVDLGYTKGGVEVEVASETHKVTVDQFGSSEINEYIMGRSCKVKAPLAETTVENLQRIMPGSTLTVSGTGVKASGHFTFTGQPAAGDSITANGVTFVFVAAATGAANEIVIGADLDATLTEIETVLSASTDFRVDDAVYAADAATDRIVVTYEIAGIAGNVFTLSADGSTISVSGSTLTGGQEAKRKAAVTNAIGVSLLETARELVLHPIAKADSDKSDDFTVPLANTAGQASFAYKLDEERIFNVEFTGYPDPNTKVLFIVGDPSA